MFIRIRQEITSTSAKYILEQRGGGTKEAWMVERPLFTRTLENVGLRKFHPHDLRHTFDSLFIPKGTKPKYVQEQLGHATIKTSWIS